MSVSHFKLVSMKLNFYVISKRNLVKMSQFNCIIGFFFFIINNDDGSKCEKLQNVLSRKISIVWCHWTSYSNVILMMISFYKLLFLKGTKCSINLWSAIYDKLEMKIFILLVEKSLR